jgi:transposase InsO family protein
MEGNMHIMHVPGRSMEAPDAISRADYDYVNHTEEPKYMGLLDLRLSMPGGGDKEEAKGEEKETEWTVEENYNDKQEDRAVFCVSRKKDSMRAVGAVTQGTQSTKRKKTYREKLTECLTSRKKVLGSVRREHAGQDKYQREWDTEGGRVGCVTTSGKEQEEEMQSTPPLIITRRIEDGDSDGCNTGVPQDKLLPIVEGEQRMAQEQRKDPWLHTLCNRLEGGEEPQDAVLRAKLTKVEHMYGIDAKGVLRKVDAGAVVSQESPVELPAHLIDIVLNYMHEDPMSGHIGFDRTYQRIKERYSFTNLYSVVQEHVRTCAKCQRNKLGPAQRPPPGEDTTHQGFPCMTLHVDYTVMQKTDGGNSHILNIVDRFTRFSKLYATGTPNSLNTAKLLMDYISTFGCPVRIYMDGGAEFRKQLVSDLCALLGVKNVKITPYNSKANGHVERTFRTLKEMVRAYADLRMNNWDKLLPMLQFAMNTAYSATTGYTPYFLHFGRRAILPLEVHWDSVITMQKGACHYIKELKAGMRDIFRVVRGKVKEAQQANRDRLVASGTVRDTIAVGDTVVVRLDNKKKGLNVKLLPQFGPKIYRVIDKPNPYCAKLVNIATKVPVDGYVNLSRLKKFATRVVPGFEAGEGEVANVRDVREHGGVKEYLVEWEGYDGRSNSWISECRLDAPNLVEQFRRSLLKGGVVDVEGASELGKTVCMREESDLLEGAEAE